MSIRIGINGFGRMGPLGFRAAGDKGDVEIAPSYLILAYPGNQNSLTNTTP